MDEFLKLMQQIDHGSTLLKLTAIGGILFKVIKSYNDFSLAFREMGRKLDVLQESALKASGERLHMKTLLTDQGLRLQYLEQKYAGIRVGDTIVPEETEERQHMRENVKHVTGTHPPAKPPKKGPS